MTMNRAHFFLQEISDSVLNFDEKRGRALKTLSMSIQQSMQKIKIKLPKYPLLYLTATTTTTSTTTKKRQTTRKASL